MKIFIPQHIRKLGIIQDLCSLIAGYAELNSSTTKDSFSHFHYYKTLSYDSVKSFIGICKYSDYNSQNSSIKEDDINYITNLFYSVKGTIKVFDYLTTFLGILIDSYIYNIKSGELYININIKTYEDIFKRDEETFKNSFEKFLKAVLYIKNLSISVISNSTEEEGVLNVEIKNNMDLYYDVKYHNYSLDKIKITSQ